MRARARHFVYFSCPFKRPRRKTTKTEAPSRIASVWNGPEAASYQKQPPLKQPLAFESALAFQSAIAFQSAMAQRRRRLLTYADVC